MYFLLSLFVSILVIFIGIKLFKKIGILDKPGSDIAGSRKPVPTIMGIFVFLAFLINIFVFYPQYYQNNVFLGLIAGGGIIVFFALLDELNYIGKIKLKTPASVRLLSHILACLVALRIGNINIEQIIIGKYIIEIPIPIFTIFFIIWSIICINAINRFDGINAQASGVSSIGFLTIFLIIKFIVLKNYLVIPENEKFILDMIQNLSLVFFGLSLVSTFIEYKPLALIRDVGVMFFGFSIAYLSVIGGAKIGTLLVALSLVIFDGVRVGVNRMFFMKKSILKGDYSHLHYRLIGLGRSRAEARSTIRIWSLVMMVLMLIQGVNRTNKLIIFFMMALIFFGVNAYLFWYKKLPCGLKMEKKD